MYNFRCYRFGRKININTVHTHKHTQPATFSFTINFKIFFPSTPQNSFYPPVVSASVTLSFPSCHTLIISELYKSERSSLYSYLQSLGLAPSVQATPLAQTTSFTYITSKDLIYIFPSTCNTFCVELWNVRTKISVYFTISLSLSASVIKPGQSKC